VNDGFGATATRFHNVLEPPRLYEHFVRHPPAGFHTWRLPDGTPMFSALLDPLLTVEPSTRRRVHAWPGARAVLDRLRLRTCFVGTTVSEYAPLACGDEPQAFVRHLLRAARAEACPEHFLIIVKDMPVQSPLLDECSNRHAATLAQALVREGFVLVAGQALAWIPIDFASSDEFLERLSRGARRDVRRKLRAREHLAVTTVSTGDPALADEALRRALHRLYRNVYAQSDMHFDFLTPAFFDAVLQDASLEGRVFLYRHCGRLVGFNLCFVMGSTLVDKYVGFDYPAARELNLYAISWMENIEYALAHGLSRFIAGCADPAVKAHLGARFTLTRHAVYVRNAVLRTVLQRCSSWFEGDRTWLEEHRHAPGRA